MTVDIAVQGVTATITALNNLGGTLADVGYETGLLEVAKVITRGARGTTLVGDKTGNFRNAWRARRGLPRYRPSALVVNRAPHAHLLLIGTKPRFQKTTGRYTGFIVGRRIVQKAAEEHRQECLQAFVRGVNKEAAAIQRELARGTRIRVRTLRNV